MEINIYLIIGILLLLGYVAGKEIFKFGLSGVVAYIFIGFLLGPILKITPPGEFGNIISSFTLAFVGFTIGASFSLKFLREMGKKMIIILIVEVLITSLFVFIFIFFVSRKLPLAIMMGCLSGATAPAGTIAVLREYRAKGNLTNMIIAIVGLDDIAGVIMFTIGIALTKSLLGFHGNLTSSILNPLWEIIGAFLIGGFGGFSVNYLIRKISFTKEGFFVLSLSFPVFIWGLAGFFNVSAILSCMFFGAFLINLNEEKCSIFIKSLDDVMTPFYILFFASVGMSIKLASLHSLWIIAILYCVGRATGKLAGAYLGGEIAKVDEKIKKYLGPALFNQAGVAVGLAYLAVHEIGGHEEFSNLILTTIALTTAIFQFVSPLGVQFAIKKAGEAQKIEE